MPQRIPCRRRLRGARLVTGWVKKLKMVELQSRTFIIIIPIALLVIACVPSENLLSFYPADVDVIRQHGPWPVPPTADPSNRVSGKPEAIALGERLFFSPRLSGSGSVLCASCHEPWRHGADGRQRALGLEPVDRNTPALANVRLHRWFGWDGANNTLWGQNLRPLLDKREMNSSAAHIAGLMRSDPELLRAYEQAFGRKPPADPEVVLVDVGKALAAYVETLDSARTSFDEFRDALIKGDSVAAAKYSVAAQRGLALFTGREACASCHAGPNFSDSRFHAGLDPNAGPGADRGRQSALGPLRINRYVLSGPFNDNPLVEKAEADLGGIEGFRTPGLRNVALTAPYMHDGGIATLCEVVQRHPVAVRQQRGRLSRREQNDLVVFLNSLSSTVSATDTTPCGD